MRCAVFRVALVVLTLAVVGAGAAGAATSTDRQLAKAGVLQLSDFPAGWKQRTRGSDSDKKVDAQAAEIARCKAFTKFATANEKNPRATSPNFERGQSNVTNAVSVYPSAAAAEAAIGRFREARIPRCLEQLYTAVYRARLQEDKRVARRLKSVGTRLGRESGIRLGDDAVVYQGTLDIGLKDGTVQTIGLGFVTVRVGAALADYSYASDTDISAALQPAIVASVTRLQRAAPSA